MTDSFEWDNAKGEANLAKHGVDFSDAIEALLDEHSVTITDEARGEERFVTFGIDSCGRLLAVVYTWRGATVRLISARKATRSEARQYAEENR